MGNSLIRLGARHADKIDTSKQFLVVAHEDGILFNPAGAAISLWRR